MEASPSLTSRRPPFSSPLSLSLLCALALGGGCSGEGDDDPSTPEPTGTPTAGACDLASTGMQPVHRFPTGHTFYLPRYRQPEACGDEPRWRLTGQPVGAVSDVEEGADGLSRFTPHQPGTYEFATVSGEGPLYLEVVDASIQPFLNYNYYGTHTQALVEGELWVANVTRPSITRLDPASFSKLGELGTGPWPVAIAYAPGMDVALVAQRGGDTLGFVDLDAHLLLDALWVGDEPADVVVSQDGSAAYVSLPTQGEIVKVDVDARAVLGRVATVRDPMALALSADGARLFVASHRSGSPERYPYPDTPVQDQEDIQVIDTRTLSVTATFIDVGVILNRLLLSADGSRLYVARRLNDTEANLGDPDEPSFIHQVAILDAETGAVLAQADLARQGSAGGPATAVHGLALSGDGSCLWVTAEASDTTLCLDPDTLEERFRAATPGRPRDVIALGTGAAVHGAQSFAVTRLSSAGAVNGEAVTALDIRSAAQKAGQAFFTGQGQSYGQEYSCNSCHLDGLTDTLIWNAGPFVSRMVPRPLFWLEGTWRLGWTGYLSSVENFAFTGATTVGVRPTTEEAQNLGVYLASIVPPPAANGLTARDGALSEQALRGKDLFEGKGTCASCHPAPLFTNQDTMLQGITQDALEPEADVPSLVGAYRHGVWLKTGNAQTLRSSVVLAGEWLGLSLADTEVEDLTRYLAELTAREFFVLDTSPRPDRSAWSVNEPLKVTFSHPVLNTPENLEQVELVRATGGTVGLQRALSADGRHLTLTPVTTLSFNSDYLIRVGAGVESLDERRIFEERVISFKTGAQPALRFEGDYLWISYLPAPDFESGGLDPSSTIEGIALMTASPNGGGAEVLVDYTGGLTQTHNVTVNGATLYVPTLPVPFGFGFADGSPLIGTLEDPDGDGVADAAAGTLSISGPGFQADGVAWEIRRPTAAGDCDEGTTGSPLVTIEADEGGQMVIGVGSSELVGLYVTSPDAVLPSGPVGTVSGEAYWVLEASNFPPNGFKGPITYGVVPSGAKDASNRHGGIPGGADLIVGQCYKVSATSVSFTVGSRTFVWRGE